MAFLWLIHGAHPNTYVRPGMILQVVYPTIGHEGVEVGYLKVMTAE